MIDQLPVWMWWVVAVCLISFTAALLKIISWFLGKFIDDNKSSWNSIKTEITKLTEGISELVVVTTIHGEKLNHHEKQINEIKASK